MRNLTFFTSNATKLAHARYLAEGRKLRIKSFRQQTYHADYDEPQSTSRDELLEASYRSAIQQCHKAGISTDVHPFILEDTSVKIDALSQNDQEYPGLDIKFWMQKATFQSLDEELRLKGSDRSATVRSDLLLHIPKSLMHAWNTTSSYVIFRGEQHGSIVESESDFKSNPVFPWLDNLSFNKWFQPDGCDKPFGALTISEANPVDFRRKSFGKLFTYLIEKQYIQSIPQQMEMPLDQKPNFILCGYTCAGKTTASQHLARKFSYLHIEASDFMHLSYFYRHGYQGPMKIGDFAEQALTEKPDIAAEKVAEYIFENLSSPAVISGFRAAEEIDSLTKTLAEHGKTFRIIFVDSDQQTRFERLQARMRPGDDMTLLEFRSQDFQQQRMGLDDIRNMETAEVENNSGEMAEYLGSMDQRVGVDAPAEIDVTLALSELSFSTNVKLEDSILLALLSVWTENETRPFYSTTEIASIIPTVFPKTQPKHKDNVSRYFNQDFYAYYEISNEVSSKIRRYRLSNTGYGMAVLALRRLTRK